MTGTTWSEADLRAKGLNPDGSRMSDEQKAEIKSEEEKKPKMPEPGYFQGLSHDKICAHYCGGDEGIFIPYEVITSKNAQGHYPKCDRSGNAIKSPNGKYQIIVYNTEQYRRYLLQTKNYWESMASIFRGMLRDKEPPYHIEFLFVRATRRAFDYANMVQGPQDLMTKYGWFKDDKADVMIPVFPPYVIDKQNPGLVIRVL